MIRKIAGWIVLAVTIGLVGLLLAAAVYAQEHEHGINGLPDWYDADCCNVRDCRPVPDEDIEFGLDKLGQPVVIHKPTGLEFERSRWRTSQDERYHACYRGITVFTPYCVYLRGGV